MSMTPEGVFSIAFWMKIDRMRFSLVASISSMVGSPSEGLDLSAAVPFGFSSESLSMRLSINERTSNAKVLRASVFSSSRVNNKRS